jgi:RNA polymerase sigma factor (sigma-70 family)
VSPSDEDLVKACLGGDKDSFGLLIERYEPRIRNLIGSMVPNPFEAEDLFQETFLQAFLGLSYLRNPASFSSWLYGIALNLIKMWFRSKRGFLSLEEVKGGIYRAGFSLESYYYPSPEVAYETVEINFLIHQAIASLPEASRSAVLMHYIDGLSLQEISILLDVPVGRIKGRLHRGREQLRKELIQKIGMASTKPVKAKEEEKKMVPVIVQDVLYEATKDEKKRELKDLAGTGRVLLLKESSGNRVMPIWMGTFEGDSIAIQLAEATTPRPMTFDLMVRLLDLSKIKIEKVVVNALKEGTFYATITVKVDKAVHEVDARPSDAIALALRTQVPISVAEEVMEEAGIEGAGPEGVVRKCREVSNQLEQELKRKPTVDEIADRMNIPKEKRTEGYIKFVQEAVSPEAEKKEWLSVKPFFAKKD